MAWIDTVPPDELRRAFTIAFMADAGTEAAPSLEEALTAHFPDEKIDALMGRVLLLFLWLETDEADALIGEISPLGVPTIHPAVYDVAASHPVPAGNIPKPRAFFRALEKRLRTYDAVTLLRKEI